MLGQQSEWTVHTAQISWLGRSRAARTPVTRAPERRHRPAPRAGRPRQLAGGAALHTALLQSQADRATWPNLTRHAHTGAPGPHAAVLNHEGRTSPAATQAAIGHQRHAPGPIELGRLSEGRTRREHTCT